MTGSFDQAAKDIALIFLHIPKAGGSTLHQILQRQYARGSIYSVKGTRIRESIREFEELDESARARIRLLKGHMSFGLHEFLPNPSTYITILRNPIDRVISLYYYVLRRNDHFAHDEVTSEKMDLKRFVKSGVVRLVDNGQTRLLSGIGEDLQFGSCSRAHLARAKQNVRTHFSVAGLLEHYDETMILLRRRFGWDTPFYVQRNVTKKRPHRVDPPKNLVELIREKNDLDLELYQYAVALFREQLLQQDQSFWREVRLFTLANRVYRHYGSLELWLRRQYSVTRRKYAERR